ncbi:hypothetical protein ASALC70_01666 [Alcanivorax sp. ALC70]|nr:hypothetical protein ASALC70_01666 [Alcanivorax sp. ALC70]
MTPRGKSTGRVEKGVRGANDYTDFLAGDPDMKGVYGGYDGPARRGTTSACTTTPSRCTPWT